MPKRGRPRKGRSLFTVKNFIEYTSDSESDVSNVLNNSYEIKEGSLQSIVEKQVSVGANQCPKSRWNEVIGETISEEDDQHHVIGETISEEEDQHHVIGETISEGEEEEEERGEIMDEIMDERMEDYHHQQQLHFEQDEIQPPQQHVQREDEQLHFEPPQQEEELTDLSDEDQSLNGEDEEDYDTIFEKLKSLWTLAEVDHCVSKTASESFWRIAMHYFPLLANAKGRKKKTPLFKTVRKHIYEDLVPPVKLEIGYKNKITGEIEIVEDTVTPVKQYSSANYEKIFEIGTVEVSSFHTYVFTCFVIFYIDLSSTVKLL